MTDDSDLERLMREGLHRRAEDADPTAPVAEQARVGARRRRVGRVAVGAAALAVAAVAVTGVVIDRSGSPGGDGTPGVANDPTGEPLPTQWRTEYWHDTQVDVPADWGWGTTPITMSFDTKSRLLCGGPGSIVRADGKRRVNPESDTPWVGRPVMLSDDCLGEPYPPAVAPYLWLGAALAPGNVDVGNGFTQETIEVNGATLTVATDDPALSRRILDSAQASEGCAASLDSAPTVDSMLTEGLRHPNSAQVCAYRREPGASLFELVYATTLGREEATAYHSQVYDGGFESAPEFCPEGRDELVLITITGDDPFGADEVSQATVVDPACREVSGSPGMVSPLSDAGMEAWSQNGLQATLYGLIGPMG